ncbi:MAG: cupin domain-containing protein [Inquilinaceae bacterium]
MGRSNISADTILAPIGLDRFETEHRGKTPLHIKGDADKFADIMSWPVLSDLINTTSLWTSTTMKLVLDNRTLLPEEYCERGQNRDRQPALVPDPAKVGLWLRRGASMVLNDIDTLTPGLRQAAGALENALGGKVQANLYCSWKAHPAFASHFDTHEVFALHIAGEKTWQVYERHFQDPISHPAFKGLGDAFHQQHKGRLTQEITLKPGDLLYLPRGWYHDAIALSDAAVHVAFGLTTPIGLDLFDLLFQRAALDPRFRAPVPRPERPGGREALNAYLHSLSDALRDLAQDRDVAESFAGFVENYRYKRPDMRLPDDATTRRFRRTDPKITVRRHGPGWVIGTDTQAVAVPPGLEQPVGWMVGRDGFTNHDFSMAFRPMSQQARDKLLRDMIAMAVIAEE